VVQHSRYNDIVVTLAGFGVFFHAFFKKTEGRVGESPPGEVDGIAVNIDPGIRNIWQGTESIGNITD
jgi:hypothetical protein